MIEFISNLKKAVGYLRGYLLKRKINIRGPIKSFGRTIVRNNNGVISIGRRSCLWPGVVFDLNSPSKAKKASVEIGEYTSIGDRTEIHCADKVKIGNKVLISWDVNIIENDYHSSGAEKVQSRPIIIEDEVWIGAHCIILKGVTIGKGSIIGAGSVVTKSIPPYSLAVGNPARIIRKTIAWTGTSEEAGLPNLRTD